MNLHLKNQEYLRQSPTVPDRVLKSKFQRQKITTETGIEINVPIDYYGDDSKIQFIPDENGTLSIVIKNVKNITT